jgi:hypothetical protein
MPVARSKADIMCLAIYTLSGGKLCRVMWMTLAGRLGIDFDRATIWRMPRSRPAWCGMRMAPSLLPAKDMRVSRR